MSRRDDLVAAIAKRRRAVEKLTAVKRRTAEQTTNLITNLTTLVKQQDELIALAPTGANNPDPGLFLGDADDQTVTIQGGSPGNPNGVTFTVSDAIRWWWTVFSGRVNYSRVRPTLLPGSKVLTDAGRAAAVALTNDPTATVAEADYNPLGLPIIP